MGKLAGKTMDWLRDAEQQYMDGMPMVQDENRRRLMQIGLDAVQEEIRSRSQKKAELQPLESPPPILEKTAPNNAGQQVRKDVLSVQKQMLVQEQQTPKTESEKQLEPVLFATDVLKKVPPPTIPIRWANGKVKEMTELELRRKAIDYFCDVLDSNFTASNFYRSAQFNNCVRFSIGLYRFGNDLLPHLALHSTFNNCGEAMQERSKELYEQVQLSWEKYKDSDI